MARFVEDLQQFQPGGKQGLELVRSAEVFTAECASRHFRERPKRKRTGWSPAMVACNLGLRAAVVIQRHMRGIPGYSRWSSATYEAGIGRILRRWKRGLRRLAKDSDELHRLLGLPSRFTIAVWQSCPFHELETQSTAAIKAIVSQLHGRRRHMIRRQISDRVRLRENLRLAGKIGRVIKSILGSFRPQYKLEVLRTDKGVILDAKKIHNLTTAYFRQWFADAPYSTAHPTDLLDCDAFVAKFEGRGVPVHLSRLVWSAAQVKASTTQEEAGVRLCDPPSIEEFRSAIRAMSQDSVAGPSRCSYNMIKSWPQPMVESVFAALLILWTDRVIPPWWKFRWLVPIPKVADPNLEDLRPLVLVEALRKVWVSIFVQRIKSFWASHLALSHSQHGFIRRKGTETALLELINAMESARQWGSSIYITSWDVTRAFDSVSKVILVHAWVRLGVPLDLAQYLVAMDIQGCTVLRSPLALQISEQDAVLFTSGLGFEAERGTGQGDIPSPLNWVAFMDILLAAFEAAGGLPVYTQDHLGHNRPSADIAYADDLISIQRSVEGIQQRADIVSAFCIIFGLRIATKKIRAFGIDWGHGSAPSSASVVLHLDGWEEVAIPLLPSGTLKYLGVHIDMDLTFSTQLRLMNEWLIDILAVISRRQASMQSKWLTLRTSVYPKIVYYAKFCSWSRQQLEGTEKMLRAFLRKISLNMTSFPTDLLFLPTGLCGLGFISFYEFVQQTKQAMLSRMERASVSSCHCISSLAMRYASITGLGGAVGYSCRLVDRKSSTYVWCSSLVEWLQSNDIHIEINGKSRSAASELLFLPQDQDLPSILSSDLTLRRQLPQHHPLASSNNLDPNSDSQQVEVAIGINQCWLVQLDKPNICQIIGITGNSVEVLSWEVRLSLQVGIRVHLADPYLGLGYGRSISKDLLRASSTLIILGPEQYEGGQVFSYIQAILKRTIVMDHTPLPSQSSDLDSLKLASIGLGRSTIFSDGSFTKGANLWDRLFTEKSAGSAGLFIRGEHGHLLARVEATLPHPSSFSMELLGLAIAHWLEPAEVKSDCQGAIALGLRAQLNKPPRHPLTPLTEPIRFSKVKTQKVKGHPERFKERCNFDADDWGIYRADRAAEPDSVVDFCLRDRSVIPSLTKSSTFLLQYQGGLVMVDVRQITYRTRLVRYLTQRDCYRASAPEPRPSRWVDSSVSLAGRIWRKAGAKHPRHRICRIIWDKHAATNLSKWNPTQAKACSLCGQTDSQVHIIYHCDRLAHVRSRGLQRIRNHVNSCPWSPLRSFMEAYASDAIEPSESSEYWTLILSPLVQTRYQSALSSLNAKDEKQVMSFLQLFPSLLLDLYGERDKESQEQIWGFLKKRHRKQDWIWSSLLPPTKSTQSTMDSHYPPLMVPLRQTARSHICRLNVKISPGLPSQSTGVG